MLSRVVLLACVALSCDAEVFVLDDSNYTAFTSSGQWIVKFYAPWCGHCKRLAPVFKEAAIAAGPDAAKFATVDCTVATVVSQSEAVRGYPTLKIVTGGKTSDLRVPRTKKELAAVARRLTAPAVTLVESPKELKSLVDNAQGPVVALGPLANEMLAGSFRNVAEYWKHEQVYAELTFGDTEGVVRLEKGDVEPVLYEGDMDAASVEAWTRAAGQRYLSLTTLDHTNFVSVINAGRPVAMAIIDPSSQPSRRFLSAYKRLALPGTTPLSDSVRSSFLFGSLDGKLYSEALQQYNVSPDDLPRVIVIDGAAGTFYEDPLVREITDVESFLSEVSRGEFPAQRSGVWAIPTQVYNLVFYGEQGWLVGTGVAAAILVVLGGTIACTYWICSGDDSEEEEEEGDKDDGSGSRVESDARLSRLDEALERAAKLDSLSDDDLAAMSADDMQELLQRHGTSLEEVMSGGVEEELLVAAKDAADADGSDDDSASDDGQEMRMRATATATDDE